MNELSFCSTPLNNKPVYEFELHDIKYKVLPTLLKAEFQDFLSIETILDNYKGKEYQALPYIIAVLAKRENETLDKYDLQERMKIFLDLPLTTANAIYLFLSDRKNVFDRFPQDVKRRGSGFFDNASFISTVTTPQIIAHYNGLEIKLTVVDNEVEWINNHFKRPLTEMIQEETKFVRE